MTEQCRHFSSDTGKRCKAVATVKVQQALSNDSAAPKQWICWTCAKHSESYVHDGQYKLTGVSNE